MFSRTSGKLPGTPVSEQKLLEGGILRREGQILYQTLREQESPQERDNVLLAEGERILERCREWGDVEWGQFIQMHNATVIEDTSYEGGDVGGNLDAWLQIFTLWKEGKGLFLVPKITKAQIDSILYALETAHNLAELRSPYAPSHQIDGNHPDRFEGGEISQEQLEDLSKATLRIVKKGLKENRHLYLPLGYRHGEENGDQVLICKIVQHTGHVTLHLLNQGDGAKEHPTVSFTTTQRKISYSYYPIKVKNALFFGEVGEALFCHLLRYLIDTPHPDWDTPYKGKHLYDLFKIVGEVVPDLGSKPEEFAVTAQRGENSAEKGVKNIVRDVLRESGLSFEEQRGVFCNVHLTSLVMGYHTYLENPSEAMRIHLQNAAINNGFLFQKIKEFLSKEEIGTVTALLTTILHKTEEPLVVKAVAPAGTLERLKETLNNSEQVVDLENPPTRFSLSWGHQSLVRTVEEWQVEEAELRELHQKKTNEQPIVQSYIPPSFSQESFLATLEEWNQKLLDLPELMRFGFFYEAVFTLPIPTADEKCVWQSFSVEEGRALLPQLKTLLLRGGESVSYGLSFELFLAHQTIYAIVDQIARQNPETKLEGYASPFPFTYLEKNVLSLPTGREHTRYVEIFDYFKWRMSQAEEKVIFPLQSEIPIEEVLKQRRKRKTERQISNHIEFISQFIPGKFVGKFGKVSLDSLASAMCGQEHQESIPQEVHFLYYFASFMRFDSIDSVGGVAFRLRQMPEFLQFRTVLNEDKKLFLVQEQTSKTTSFVCQYPLSNLMSVSDLGGLSSSASFLVYLQYEVVQGLTTNEAICSPPKLESLPDSISRDLLRLTRRKNLKVGQALDWLGSHFFFLNSSEVKETLINCFLAPGLLPEALEREPSLMKPLRETIRKGLAYLGESSGNQEEALFLISLGVSFELIYKEIFPDDPIDQFLGEYHSILLSIRLHKFVNRALRFTIQTERGDLSLSEIETLLLDILQGNERKFLGLWLQKHGELLQNEEFVNNLCTRALPPNGNALIIVRDMQASGEVWSGVFPDYTCGPYHLNILTKTFHHEEKGEIDQEGWNETRYGGMGRKTELDGLQYLISKSGLNQKIKWEVETEKLSKDGSLRLRSTPYGVCGERKLTIGGKERWMVIHSRNHQIVCYELTQALSHEIDDVIFYVPKVREEGDPEVWVYSLKGDIPLYRADSYDGFFTLSRVTKEGVVTTEQKVNMASLIEEAKSSYPDHPLAKHFANFANPCQVECTLDLKLGEIDRLYLSARSSTSPLSFKRGEYGYESERHRGFYLTDLKTLPQLNGFEGGLILENAQEERRLFLWNRPLYVESVDSFRKVFVSKSYGSEVYQYQVTPVKGTLETENNEGNLYLSYLFSMQKEYQTAAFYLDRVSSLDSISEKSISYFTENHDRSPSAIAFNMKLIYKCVEARSQLTQATLLNKNSKSFFSWHWAISVYVDYLSSVSHENLSPIPRALLLSKGEEKTILSYMARSETELPQTLRIRYDLLTRAGGKMNISISPVKVDLVPRMYKKLALPSSYPSSVGPSLLEIGRDRSQPYTYRSYPIRLSDFDISAHFPELYERAKRTKQGEVDPFDFTLATIMKQDDSVGTLLTCVRFFPEEYNSITFEDPSNSKQTQETWEAIQKKTEDFISSKQILDFSNLKYLRKFQHLVKKVWKEERGGTFEYSRTFSVQYPNPNPPLPFAETILGRPQNLQPLVSCIQGLFTQEEIPIPPSSVEIPLPPRANPLEECLYRSFEEGRGELPTSRTTYHFHSEHLRNTEQKLLGKLSTLRMNLQKKREKVVTLLNIDHEKARERLDDERLEKEIQYKLDSRTNQTLPLLPETVMKESILRNDASFLRKHRPLLSEEEAKQVIRLVKEYYYELMVVIMTKEALQLLKSYKDQPNDLSIQKSLASLLHYNFPDHFNPYEYPEIAYFKVTNGKLPREGQLERYLWVCEGMVRGENRLFQMQAGGGKTSYLAPMIMLRAKMMGYLPVFCSTQSIYPIDKANLHNTLKTLEDRLALLEVGMHMNLNVEDLKFIFDHLRIYREEGRELIITPQIFYALHLLYKYAAYEEENVEKVKWLSLIFAFFKKRGFLLPDESHRNLDALTRAIYGIKEVDFLPGREHKLFIEMMKPLLGLEKVLCEDGVPVAERGRLQTNAQGIAGPKEIKEIRKALAKHMLTYRKLHIPEDAQKAFLTYWTEKQAPQPDLLREWARENDETKKGQNKADAAALIHYFLHSLLPQIIKMRTELDHAPSLFPEEEFDTPCYKKIPSTAQFEDVYRTVALSIKGTFHRGLSKEQVRSLLSRMILKDRTEQPKIPSTMPTPTMEEFRDWMGDKNISIRKVSPKQTYELGKIYQRLRHHPKAIEVYLVDFILPNISHPSELITTTPVNLLGGFAQSVSFSATPYFSECYPQSIDAFSYDRPFEAQVVIEYCKPENQDYLFPESTDPASFFSWVSQSNPGLMEEVGALIDPGGFFCDHENERVARLWLDSTDLDGVLYFQQGNPLSADRDEKICLLLKGERKVESIFLEGNQLIQVLEQRGLEYGSLRIGTYYDAAHTESADMIQKEETKALVFGGDTLTSSHLIQAIMRLRGFLDPEKNQTIVWVFQNELAVNIRGKGDLTGERIFAWSVKNEVREMKKRIILAAFQEISYYVERIAWEQIESALHDPEKQMELFKRYERGFCLRSPNNPYLRYGEPEVHLPTERVLWNFAKQEYARFGYSTHFDDLPNSSAFSEAERALHPAIKGIVSQTKPILHQIATNFHNKISQEVEQQTHALREVNQEQHCSKPGTHYPADYTKGTVRIDDPKYPDKVLKSSSAQSLFDPLLTKRLYFSENQLRTATLNRRSLGVRYLKPIDFFVIVHHNEQYFSHAVCNESVSVFVDILSQEIEKPQLKHTAFIVTAEGYLYRRGRGDLAPSPAIVEEVLNSQWLQDLVIDAGLLKGEVRYPDRLKERIADWPDFPKFWKKITKAQPNPESANEIIIKQILKDLNMLPSKG